MGNILIVAGSILCLTGVASLVFAVIFFGKQRAKLIDRINDEYREA